MVSISILANTIVCFHGSPDSIAINCISKRDGFILPILWGWYPHCWVCGFAYASRMFRRPRFDTNANPPFISAVGRLTSSLLHVENVAAPSADFDAKDKGPGHAPLLPRFRAKHPADETP
ncbi:hypothetical protein BDZ45DRAFT_259515 [Acephala macrosclerotiorum]|nr:hypothetical protein BDZ45DRAFT_259515 [Acephala macrosclerotiorum]